MRMHTVKKKERRTALAVLQHTADLIVISTFDGIFVHVHGLEPTKC